MNILNNKVVVVTDGGMGRAYALRLAKLGSRPALNDSDGTGPANTFCLLRKTIERCDNTPLLSVMLNLSTSAKGRNAG
ncbi:MAG: NAD(P)-dependent dehydrogenase (short-subunit alcohol dehydrogenase family) [Zhongshania sp.]|jgi:NAD(P)-dependent dehydrogenase (short-subunit alcohol dehydrogenase family)